MFYTKEELQSLSRKELQKLCKQFSIKANKKNCELVAELVEYFGKLQKEEQALKEDLELKEWMSEEEEEPPKISEETDETKTKDQMKEDLMKEVEKRAFENLTKIPRFCVDKVTVPDLMSPAGQKIKTSQKKHFKKLDSIDVYMEKKRKRAEYQLSYNSKLKAQAEENLKKMKLSHNTPKNKAASKNTRTRKSKEGTPMQNRRKSFMSPFKPTVFKVDKEVTFNFVSKMKSPKPILTNKPALREKNSKVAEKKKAAIEARKSVQFSKADTRKSGLNKSTSRLNVTIGDLRSPAMKFSQVSSASKKTPKFDLQASLKKRLSYKPHAGKLKENYNENANTSTTNFNANSTFNVSNQKSVKEITKPKVTRTDRRNEVTKRRVDKRSQAASKRRGIVA